MQKLSVMGHAPSVSAKMAAAEKTSLKEE